jgi:uncharacterized membrane protein YedE/YeeE
MIARVTAFLSGLVFAIGLAVSGMSRPRKVLAFLDVAGDWDPSLAFVMAGAIGVSAIAFHFILRRARPLAAPRFAMPVPTQVDARLVVGSVLFGAGWGLGGFCPGPALLAIATGAAPALVFVAAMIAGMILFDRVYAPRRGARADVILKYNSV